MVQYIIEPCRDSLRHPTCNAELSKLENGPGYLYSVSFAVYEYSSRGLSWLLLLIFTVAILTPGMKYDFDGDYLSHNTSHALVITDLEHS